MGPEGQGTDPFPPTASEKDSYLVLPLQHQQVGHLPEGKPQSDHFRLVHIIGQLADVDHT